jgi:uncharacterized membrane protein
MTPKERQTIIAENVRLRSALRAARRSNRELREENANLRVERDTADVLLGEAMDAALEVRRR